MSLKLTYREVKAGMELCVSQRGSHQRQYGMVLIDGFFSRERLYAYRDDDEPSLNSCVVTMEDYNRYRMTRNNSGNYVACLLRPGDRKDVEPNPAFISRAAIHCHWAEEQARLDQQNANARQLAARVAAERAEYLGAVAVFVSKMAQNEHIDDLPKWMDRLTNSYKMEERLGFDTQTHHQRVVLHRSALTRLAALLASVDVGAADAADSVVKQLRAENAELARRVERAEERVNAMRFLLLDQS